MSKPLRYFSNSKIVVINMPLGLNLFILKYGLEEYKFTKKEDAYWDIIKQYVNEIVQICPYVAFNPDYQNLSRDVDLIASSTGFLNLIQLDINSMGNAYAELQSVSHLAVHDIILDLTTHDLLQRDMIVHDIETEHIVLEVSNE